MDTSGQQFRDMMDRLMRSDATWTEVNLPWAPEFWTALTPETLARLNPHWEIARCDGETLDVHDHLLDEPLTVRIRMHANHVSWVAEIEPLGVALMARSHADGANTLFTSSGEPPMQANVPAEFRGKWAFFWLRSLREYLRVCGACGLSGAFWRLFMRRCWLTMTPQQRRVSLFLVKFTVIEMILIVALGLGYWLYLKF